MCDHYNYPVEQSECDESNFSIIIAVVEDRQCDSQKHLFKISKINPGLFEISLPFLFIPLEFQAITVVTFV